MTDKKELEEAFKRFTFFPKTKIDYLTFRKLRALKVSKVGYKSWTEFFRFLTREQNLEPTLHERVQAGTAKNLLQTWMHNFADNMVNIRYGDTAQFTPPTEYKQTSLLDIVEWTPILESDSDFATAEAKDGRISEINGMKVKNPPKSSAVVIGRGPSLFRHHHLKMLKEAKDNGYNGLVVCSDGGLIPTLEAGVVPDVVVSVDGAPIIKKYFEHPLVKEHGKEIMYIAAVTVHPSTYQAARAAGLKTYWFSPTFDDWRQNESWTRMQRLLSTTTEYPRGIATLNTGGNAGSCAWICAMEIFKRSPCCLIGMDMGYPADTPLEQTQYYDSMIREAHGDAELLKKAYPQFYHPTFKTKAYVDLVFNHYRLALIELQQSTALWYRLYGGTINCTEGGTLFGAGIECMNFDQFLCNEFLDCSCNDVYTIMKTNEEKE